MGEDVGFRGVLVVICFFQVLKRAPPWGLFMVEGKFGDFTAGAVIMYFLRS